MKDEIVENESQPNDENDEDKISDEIGSSEVEDEGIITSKNDEYTDASENNNPEN